MTRTVFKKKTIYPVGMDAYALEEAYRILDEEVEKNPDYENMKRYVRIEKVSGKVYLYMSISKVPSKTVDRWVIRSLFAMACTILSLLIWYDFIR